jgi:hypothetical protein
LAGFLRFARGQTVSYLMGIVAGLIAAGRLVSPHR